MGGVISPEAWNRGLCDVSAAWLARATGWDVVARVDVCHRPGSPGRPEARLRHCVAVAPDGIAWDVEGQVPRWQMKVGANLPGGCFHRTEVTAGEWVETKCRRLRGREAIERILGRLMHRDHGYEPEFRVWGASDMIAKTVSRRIRARYGNAALLEMPPQGAPFGWPPSPAMARVLDRLDLMSVSGELQVRRTVPAPPGAASTAAGTVEWARSARREAMAAGAWETGGFPAHVPNAPGLHVSGRIHLGNLDLAAMSAGMAGGAVASAFPAAPSWLMEALVTHPRLLEPRRLVIARSDFPRPDVGGAPAPSPGMRPR